MIVTASIVLFDNDETKLSRLIASLDTTHLINKVFVIDNSQEMHHARLFLSKKYEYFHMSSNLGFGAGHNFILHRLESEYHFYINPDIYFDSKNIDLMINRMCQDLDIGLLSPQILFPNGEIQYLCKLNPSFFSLFLRRFVPNFLKGAFERYLSNYEMRFMDYSQDFSCTYLSGCFMLFRTSVLKSLKGFDDNFFLYLEDADITLRASKISKTIHFAGAQVFHFWEKGSYKSIKLAFITFQSMIYYFKKHGFRLF